MRLIKNPWIGTDGYKCFGCCPTNPVGVKMQFYEDGNDVISIWHPNELYQSWDNILHGGVQSVLLDEICGWVVFHKLKASGVTAKMETRYRKPVIIRQKHIELRARLRETKRNIAIVEGEILGADGELLVECTCTYFTFAAEHTPQHIPFRATELIGEDIKKEDLINL